MIHKTFLSKIKRKIRKEEVIEMGEKMLLILIQGLPGKANLSSLWECCWDIRDLVYRLYLEKWYLKNNIIRWKERNNLRDWIFEFLSFLLTNVMVNFMCQPVTEPSFGCLLHQSQTYEADADEDSGLFKCWPHEKMWILVPKFITSLCTQRFL